MFPVPYQNIRFLLVFCGLVCLGNIAMAQDLKTTVRDNKELDSLRNKLDNGKDSVIFTSKYVRFTTLGLTKDSIQTFPLDTSLRGIQNFSIIEKPRRPTIGTGNIGNSVKPLLFEPEKTIGFEVGFHALDFYLRDHTDIIYYQARSPFTNLYYASGGGETEQLFRVTHSQNVKPNWNVGGNYNRIGANGAYTNQRGDVLNADLFTWYQSPNKRYNLWSSAVFNTLKAKENGAVSNNDLYTDQYFPIAREAEVVRLRSARQLWRKNSFLLKQSYFIGRIDSVDQPVTKKILPTNKVSYSLSYTNSSFAFVKSEADDHSVIPVGIIDTVNTNDSTNVKHLQNEFIYSFFLRAKSSAIIKNELKIDLGIRNDYYQYAQYARYADLTDYYKYTSTFQNSTLLGSMGYRFSNRIDLNVDLQQIFSGKQIGDFLYEAKSNVLLSNSVGRIVLGAYLQNKSPEEIYDRYFGNHYNWINNFDRTKTVNFSFKYINDKLKLDAGAEYFLINDYLYFAQRFPGQAGAVDILPQQQGGSINLLKVSLGKTLSFGKFNLESYIVYQKTDHQSILRTPEVYTFNSFYLKQTFFKVLKTNVGFDIRYNTPYSAYSYSPAAGQFYVGDDVKLYSEPVVDVWIRAGLRKANLFLKYDYVNQGLFYKGYYTVNKYPMPDRLLKFGVSWNFYD